ncbi:MAG: TonB C-terminal domain-containing protein [Desulfobulbaceae bacterium]|nr:TonB C-terminal domain-containing protein [Desulfobulbaceae bacterium]
MIEMEQFAPFFDQGLTSKQARVAMALAVAVHLGTFLIGIFSPYLLNGHPPIHEIYTVNLIAVSEPVSRPASEPRIIRKIQPATHKKVVTAKSPEVKPSPPAAAPAKPAISTQPIRHKTSSDLNAIDALRQQLIAKQAAAKAAEEARKAKLEAMKAIRESLHSEPRPTIDISARSNDTAVLSPASGPAGGQIIEEAKRQYFAAVYELIKTHFVLPDLKNWNSDLQSILVINVRKDGIVTKSFFELKSDNIFFNQAVERALRDAGAMPPFPAALKESSLEFGLRFKPGDLLK